MYVDNLFQEELPLTRNFHHDFIILKWDTIVLSLIDLDLPMPTTLSNFPIGKNLRSEKCLTVTLLTLELLLHNPNTLKVRAITGAYNLHDVELEDDTEEFQDAPQPDQLD